DFHVTGVQTCALPISGACCSLQRRSPPGYRHVAGPLGGRAPDATPHTLIVTGLVQVPFTVALAFAVFTVAAALVPGTGIYPVLRSEERRVGKEGRSRA